MTATIRSIRSIALIVFLSLCAGINLQAQYLTAGYQYTLSTENYLFTSFSGQSGDSLRPHSPKQATIMSAIVPGAGQAYNQKYWKIGVIYAGFTGLAIGFKYNNDSMKRYQKALDYRVDDDTNTIDIFYPLLSDNKVKQERNYYRSNRDRVILGFVALYALQIIDANVDAHLKEFEINKDLSMRVAPHFNYTPSSGFRPSLNLTFSF